MYQLVIFVIRVQEVSVFFIRAQVQVKIAWNQV